MADLKEIIEESFSQYAGAVLQSRALVDVRDCIKPSARQIFYCLYTDKFLPNKPFNKTLKALGSAARMYIHGDSSCTGVIMRAGQPFALRYPLIEIEGNEGNLMQSGNWAAPRYTASRLSKLSVNLFSDIDKNTIEEWRDNYDDTEQYPIVLPSKGFYNIVNGCQGIGIGAASSIPQFNLREVNNALIHLLQNPDCSFDEIYCAPDFATGAILLNENDVKKSLEAGEGVSCRIRSVVNYDTKEKCLVVTEIPYGVYTNTICKELEEIEQSEENPGIDRHNDLTGVTPLIKIYLKKTAYPEKVLKYLYKNTSLQYYFGINFTMLENGRFPKVFGWKQALQAHIDHEKIVYRRGFEYDLKKIKDRIHIIDGLLICLARIEEVVQTIKASNSTADAKVNLCKDYLLDEAQATAILKMQLSRLAHLEVKKLEKEKEDLLAAAAHIEEILNDEQLFNQQLINGWLEVAAKFGDERRTQILNLGAGDDDEPTEIKQLILSFTNKGSVFVTEGSTLFTQKRGGVGSKFKLEKNEYIVDTQVGNNNDMILFFSNAGTCYSLHLNDFPIGQKVHLNGFVDVRENEEIKAATILSKDNKKEFITFITKKGYIKKSSLNEYKLTRKDGIKAISLEDDDKIINVLIMSNETIGIASAAGNFIRIETKDIRPQGRVTRGVIGMKLNAGDCVRAAHIIPDNTTILLSVSRDGLAKYSAIEEFDITGKGTKGKKIQKLNAGEELADFLPLANEKEVLIISSAAQLKAALSDFSLLSRNSLGNKAINLKAGNQIICLQKI